MRGPILLAIAFAIATCFRGAAAQACAGILASDQQGNAGFTLSFPNHARSYNGNLAYNMAGPLSLQVAAGVSESTNVNDDGFTVGGRAAFEINKKESEVKTLSLCPLAGLTYGSSSADVAGFSADATSWVIPIGIGLGTKLDGGRNASVVLNAVPHLLHVRTSYQVESGVGSVDGSSSDTEFGVDIGFMLQGRLLYAGIGLNMNTFGSSTSTLSVMGGFIFGKR